MVVAGILALALALPTGALFGIGYGTGVRIGYEQIYPLLFPAKEDGTRNTTSTVENVNQINKIYNAIGGKEASQMGMATGIAGVMTELDKNPDFQSLLKLESSPSGNTLSTSDSHQKVLEKILLSLSQASPFNTEEIRTTNTPGGFLLNPVLDIPFEEGPANITDRFGYGAMTRTELLNNQPSQMNPRPSNEKERQINWQHFYDRALADYLQGINAKQEPSIPTLDKTQVSKLQTDYVVKRAQLLTVLYQKLDILDNLLETQRNSPDYKYNQYVTPIKNATTQKQNAQKLLQNHITLARNKISLKALANNDWNKRIWKV